MDARRALSLLAGLGVGLGLSLAPASAIDASDEWLAPTRLGPGQYPAVAASADGDVVAAWASVENGGVVRASFRPAGGRWQPVVEWPAGWALAPRLAIDRDGSAIVVWSALRGSSAIVEASVRPARGRWEAPTAISDVPGWAGNARVAMDAAGNALVAWRSSSHPDPGIHTRYRSAATGTWQPASGVISYAYSELELAMAPGGRALLAWDVSKDVPHVVMAAVGQKGAWGAARELGGVYENAAWETLPRSIAPAIGDTVAVVGWQYAVHGNRIVRAGFQPAGGQWEPAVDLSFGDGQAFSPALVIDGGGDVLAAWDANVDVEGSTRTAGRAGWERPIVVSSSHGAPTLAANARGDAVALWWTYRSTPGAVQAARKPATAVGWEATSDLATGGTFGATRVAIDGAGDAVAVWQRYDGGWWIEVAASDVAPPVVTRLVAPRSGIVRKPVRFSVATRDTWSRVAPPAWSFGDGTRARGAIVTHRFRSPGRYRVTVTVADALGHGTTRVGTIRVRR